MLPRPFYTNNIKGQSQTEAQWKYFPSFNVSGKRSGFVKQSIFILKGKNFDSFPILLEQVFSKLF